MSKLSGCSSTDIIYSIWVKEGARRFVELDRGGMSSAKLMKLKKGE